MDSYSVDRERWNTLSLVQQLGNVSSEVGRAINAQRAGKTKRAEGAFDRALDLLDATIDGLVAQGSPRLKEVLRAREAFVALFYDDAFESDADAVERYFNWFALAARAETDKAWAIPQTT